MQDEKKPVEEHNPFYSLIDKGNKSFLLGLSKINIMIIAIIFIILTVGMVGVYFFNEDNKEKRISKIGEWYVGLGSMICETNKECEVYIDSTVKDSFIENSFIPPEKIDIEELKKQFSEELLSIKNFNANKEELNVWIDKCIKHPDINTATAIRYCALLMMLLDENIDKQFLN